MRRITFVRHAMPEVDAAVAPTEWPISAEGSKSASALRLQTGPAVRVISSPERRARETAASALTVSPSEVDVADSFREVDRQEAVHRGFRDARRAWVAGRLDSRHDGWETPDAAARRFHHGLLAHPAEHLIVSTHGMVLTAWIVAMGLVRPGDAAVAFWESLAFPDIIDLSVPLLRVRAALTDADGRFILIKRTRPGQEPYWTAPGGGVELSDASPEDALRRELREELGAQAEVGPVLFERPIDGIRSEIFYRAQLISMELFLRDGPEFDDPARGAYDIEFVTREQIIGLDLRPTELKDWLLRH
ncbi:NUDIX domain-containing protein [Microbacterium sp.]|uniref:NUDIX domain-containing protein n=1 Tax=Microbacterium sp. TaxID=51671 RepID=UPI003A93144D